MHPFLARLGTPLEISPEDLTALAKHGRQRTFPANTPLVRQGDPADSLFVIVSGRVRVERSHPDLVETFVLAEFGPDTIVGEMGLLDGEPRSATVTAIEETETVEITETGLDEVLARHPEVARALLRLLSRRLRRTDELITEIIRKNR